MINSATNHIEHCYHGFVNHMNTIKMKLKGVTGKVPLEVVKCVEEFQAPTYTLTSGNHKFEFCMLRNGPYWIHRCARLGDVKEVIRILTTDLSRLNATNKAGKTALHVAAYGGRTEVVKTLIKFGAELDLPDSDGNTSLHLGVKSGEPDVVIVLLTAGAHPQIRNKLQMMPIHVAAELNNVYVIEALLDNANNPNWTGENGMTALHYAAAKDNGDALIIMMARGGKLGITDNYGVFPIHTAAKCAASKAMEAILEKAHFTGWTTNQILNLNDRENNFPLHAAVHSGDIKAVMVCLSYGASLKSQQTDGSTPIHFACAMGNLAMIKAMKEMRRNDFIAAIGSVDAMRMTPLHRASLFNYTAIIEYLIEHGADMDCRDINNKTPLLLAVSKSCWAAAQLLVSRGAAISIKDRRNRNFLHIAIKAGGRLDQSGATHVMQDMVHLQNEKDDYGCIPLHYAAKGGHLSAVNDLLKTGSIATIKNKMGQSPFHFAARYGRYSTCYRLLDSNYGSHLLNETDGEGLTVLHVAAKNGHTDIVELLLQRGAVVSRDHLDNTALHLASGNGWVSTMKAIMSVHFNLIDVVNKDKETPLHLAAKNGHSHAVQYLLTMGAKITFNAQQEAFFDYIVEHKYSEVATAVVNHDRWDEVLQTCSRIYGSFLLGLIEHLPAVSMTVLDRCQTFSEDDPKSENFHITYNFAYLETPKICSQVFQSKKDERLSPMKSLNAMVAFNRVECLSHPVCVTFIKVKWESYGFWVYAAYLVVYIVHLFCLTNFIIGQNSLSHYDANLSLNSSKRRLYGNRFSGYSFTYGDWVNLWFVFLYNIGNIMKEFAQMYTMKQSYFGDTSNALEWTLYLTSLLFVTPFLVFKFSFHWQWESGAVAVFLAWFNCLVFLQRFDFFGIYVVMFLEILRTLLQVLCVFSLLIIAFGLSLFMLMFKEESKAYSTPLLSVLRSFMMMLEPDYINSFNQGYTDDRDDTIHFGPLTLIMLILFVLLMPILLMNLLIGLAVGDIESVQRDARLKRLAMQVEIHVNIERKIPTFFLEQVAAVNYKHYPNRLKQGFINEFFGIFSSKEEHDSRVIEANVENEALFDELYERKRKLKDMGGMIEKNHDLIRLISMKMGIRTQDEEWDVGDKLDSDDSSDEMGSTQAGPKKSRHVSETSRSHPRDHFRKFSQLSDV